MLTAILLCLLPAARGGGSLPPPNTDLNTAVAESLSKAAQDKDPSAYPLTHEVLLDILGHRYKYYKDARVAAFEYIRATNRREAIPLLKEVARIRTQDDDSFKTVLDAWAVKEALSSLLSLGSPDTATLSREQVFAHPLVQITAIDNLKDLEFWRATPDVERMLCSTATDEDHHVELASAAEFLEASPEASRAICPCIDKISTALGDKFYAPLQEAPSVFYRRLGDFITALGGRLNCK